MNNIIREWLQINCFELKEINGYQYYCSQGNYGCRSFEYYIQSNFLLIYAYIYTPDKAIPIDTVSGLYYHDLQYKEMVDKLLLRIENIPGVTVNTYAQRYQTQNGQYNYQQTYARIENNNQEYTGHRNKNTDSRLAYNVSIFAFAMSLMNLVLSLMGMSLRIHWIIFAICGAITGLKGEKKWIPILTFIIFAVSIAIFLLQF